jgi:hypothetical protein
MTDVAQQCPWCGRWALKDAACNWVTCGLATEGFMVAAGCGHQFCFLCGKKLCGAMFDSVTGAPCPGAASHHTATCCLANIEGSTPDDVCPGGHNSHK